MKLLITGGAGFIGSNFILYWMRNHPDDFVVNLDTLTYAGNLENLEEVSHKSNYKFIRGDICDPVVVERAMEGVDLVVHFAAESHVDRSIREPSAFISTNIIGTYVLLEEATKRHIRRFHHISTDEVFGSLELSSSNKFSERTIYNPRSPYSATKASSDHLALSYFHTYGLNVTLTNCSNNFGPFQFPEKFIPLVITNALEGKTVPLYGDGLYVRDWLYVEDHVRAIELVLTKGKSGETYCIGGNGENINNLAVVKKILEYMNVDQSLIEFVKDRKGHDRRYAIDWSKIHNELGWEPLHDFDKWLHKTIEWYRGNQSWWSRIKSGAYIKYYTDQYDKAAK